MKIDLKNGSRIESIETVSKNIRGIRAKLFYTVYPSRFMRDYMGIDFKWYQELYFKILELKIWFYDFDSYNLWIYKNGEHVLTKDYRQFGKIGGGYYGKNYNKIINFYI